MPHAWHQDVRTTLTLDDDVARKLRAEMRRTGQFFKDTVNQCLRPGLSLDNIADLLEQLEGPVHRRS